MLNISSKNLETYPYPHIIQENIFDLDFYKELEKDFPNINVFPPHKGEDWYRMSRDLIKGDEAYTKLMNNSAAWKKLHNYIYSQKFVDLIISLFGMYFKEYGCLVNPQKANFVDHLESRQWMTFADVDKEIKKSKANPNDLFCRLDFGLGEIGYIKDIHLDWRHRLISLLIYFSDANEQKMEGGNFYLNKKENDDFKKVKAVKPKSNTAVLMLDTNNSYHSVDELKYSIGPRKSLYIAVSSRRNIWETSKVSKFKYWSELIKQKFSILNK